MRAQRREIERRRVGRLVERGQCAQRGDGCAVGDRRGAADFARRRRQPRSKQRQLIAERGALARKCLRPAVNFDLVLIGSARHFGSGKDRRCGQRNRQRQIVLGNFRRARCQLLRVTPHRSQRGVALGNGVFKRSRKADHDAWRLQPDRFAQNFERVADTFDPARMHDRRLGERRKSRAQGQQMTRQIAAVDRRNVSGRQRR